MNTNLKIGTHDSATGEKGYGLLSALVMPFSRTQSKTLRQQFHAGCTAFDIRIRKTRRGWVCAHGLWQTRRKAYSIFQELNDLATTTRIYVSVTLEGNEKDKDAFYTYGSELRRTFPHIIWGAFCIKYSGRHRVKVSYQQILAKVKDYTASGKQGFVPLDATNPAFLLPIPWLWDRLLSRPHTFNTQTYTYVDFL